MPAPSERLLAATWAAQGDGGLLFALALVVAACSAFVLVVRRGQLPVLGQRRVAR